MQTVWAFQLLFLAIAVHSGESIKCFNCDSATDPKCADPFLATDNNNFLKECTPQIAKQAGDAFNKLSKSFTEVFTGSNQDAPTINTEFHCVKVDLSHGDKVWTVRQCAPPMSNKVDYCQSAIETGKQDSNKPKITFCETCDKDSCNGATNIQAAILAFIFPCAALLLARFH